MAMTKNSNVKIKGLSATPFLTNISIRHKVLPISNHNTTQGFQYSSITFHMSNYVLYE